MFDRSVRPLAHPGCGDRCRDLCFVVRDPRGVRVSLEHAAWNRVLEKANRAQMANLLGAVERAIENPNPIQRDPDDRRCLLYYGAPQQAGGKLLCVSVKCLPRSFQGESEQNRYRVAGLMLRNGLGEAWVSSAYLLDKPKRRGVLVWPS